MTANEYKIMLVNAIELEAERLAQCGSPRNARTVRHIKHLVQMTPTESKQELPSANADLLQVTPSHQLLQIQEPDHV